MISTRDITKMQTLELASLLLNRRFDFLWRPGTFSVGSHIGVRPQIFELCFCVTIYSTDNLYFTVYHSLFHFGEKYAWSIFHETLNSVLSFLPSFHWVGVNVLDLLLIVTIDSI